MQPWYFSANKGIMHVHNRNKGIMIEIVEKISKISCFFASHSNSFLRISGSLEPNESLVEFATEITKLKLIFFLQFDRI